VVVFTRGVLLQWIGGFLPEWEVEAPVPVKRLSPEEMKDALVGLALKEVLKGPPPAGTRNLVVFNNATVE
jgi:hypothetical protein